MFALTADPIEDHPALRTPHLESAGAHVIFEGRVRRHNQNRPVRQLDYEGAAELAENEFAHIEQEACRQFEVAEVACVHRVGRLYIGDLAVWIRIQAAHRGPAFDACRYVIDELKKRLPIWKKEYYDDGDSGWIAHA
jgi:molybdopterin synthase catalytic subunit